MSELAEVFQQYGAEYRAKYGERMLPSHKAAMKAIEECRTEQLGGHVYNCKSCEFSQYSYHSCRNRHCPKCQNEAGQLWLERQQGLLLPTDHFMVTFTLPAALRSLARSNQKLIYKLLFQSSAAALQELAKDPRFVGGQIGMVGVLHTWGRDMSYHPHIHYLVPGGGLSADGQQWLSSRPAFLVHVKPLSKLFKAKFQAALEKTKLSDQLPYKVWTEAWVVHSKAVDNGQAALKYLAPYIFRVAISNKRIVKVAEGKVTFSSFPVGQHTPSGSKKSKLCTLPAEAFIHRFLHHVLPKGFVKVRYYGLFSPGQRQRLKQAKDLLVLRSPPDNSSDLDPSSPEPVEAQITPAPILCPKCGQPMAWQNRVKPVRSQPP